MKLTLEYVKKEAVKFGKWEIIDDVYTNSSTRLECVCLNCGFKHGMSWDNIKQNKGCKNCNNINNTQRLDIKYVRASFKKAGYTLLTTTYNNNIQKLWYICPVGHKHGVTWNNWNTNKRRCPYCSGNAKYIFDEVKFIFKSKGFTILDAGYVNNSVPIRYECSEGHIHKIRLSDLLNGDGCPYCSPGKVKRYLTTELVKSELAEKDYDLLSDYINSRTKFLYKCPKGHINSMTYRNWYSGCRCPTCVENGTSLFEQEVKNYVDSLDIQFISNDRTTVFNKITGRYLEFDLWFPELNKAIECNGSYWHEKTEAVKKDIIKIQECTKLKIKMLTVDYNDWKNNKLKYKNRILRFLLK